MAPAASAMAPASASSVRTTATPAGVSTAMAAIMPAATLITAMAGIAVMSPTVVAEKTDFRPVVVIAGVAGISRFRDTPGERQQCHAATRSDGHAED